MNEITNDFKKVNSMLYKAFCDPVTHKALDLQSAGLAGDGGVLYKFIGDRLRVIDFIEPSALTALDSSNLAAYSSSHSTEIYRNFLNWLFETFNVTEENFRNGILKHLKLEKGMKVLVTGCGLGEDIPLIMQIIGETGELHAQDLSKSMVINASGLNHDSNVCFSISNGNSLPYVSRYFDVVYHFGGINLFGDTRKAIAEIERVCKIGGRVVFGDEGIAPHLRGTQYADIAINNNKLWASETPLHMLPHNALDIELTYILGNCFYLLSFTPSEGFPEMNIDIPHKGTRGGTARTRYFGSLEGVTDKTKAKVICEAKRRGLSIHEFLEMIINSQIP